MAEVKPKKQLQALSTGDGIAVVVLVIFIFAWAAGWIFILGANPSDSSKTEDLGWVAVILLAILVLGPPLWAMDRVKEIIRKEAKD